VKWHDHLIAFCCGFALAIAAGRLGPFRAPGGDAAKDLAAARVIVGCVAGSSQAYARVLDGIVNATITSTDVFNTAVCPLANAIRVNNAAFSELNDRADETLVALHALGGSNHADYCTLRNFPDYQARELRPELNKLTTLVGEIRREASGSERAQAKIEAFQEQARRAALLLQAVAEVLGPPVNEGCPPAEDLALCTSN
jgi:hypothetical protein